MPQNHPQVPPPQPIVDPEPNTNQKAISPPPQFTLHPFLASVPTSQTHLASSSPRCCSHTVIARTWHRQSTCEITKSGAPQHNVPVPSCFPRLRVDYQAAYHWYTSHRLDLVPFVVQWPTLIREMTQVVMRYARQWEGAFTNHYESNGQGRTQQYSQFQFPFINYGVRRDRNALARHITFSNTPGLASSIPPTHLVFLYSVD